MQAFHIVNQPYITPLRYKMVSHSFPGHLHSYTFTHSIQVSELQRVMVDKDRFERTILVEQVDHGERVRERTM